MAKSRNEWYKIYFSINGDTLITSIKLGPEWKESKLVKLSKHVHVCMWTYLSPFIQSFILWCAFDMGSLHNRLSYQSYHDVQKQLYQEISSKVAAFLHEFENVYSRRSLSFPHVSWPSESRPTLINWSILTLWNTSYLIIWFPSFLSI